MIMREASSTEASLTAERSGEHCVARRSMGAAERWAPLVTGIALAIPSLVAYYLPMSDLPLHEGVVGTLRHYGDPEYFPPGLYELNLGHPNQLFHVIAWGLAYLVGSRWALKIVIAITQVLILLAGQRLADHLGRSRWSTLLLAPLALGFTYHWGLIANLVGFAAFFGALPTIDRVSIAPTWKSLLRVCGVLTLLFFAHESVFVIACAFAGMLAVARPIHKRLTALRLVPVMFGAVVFVAHLSIQKFPASKLEIPPVWTSLWDKLIYAPNDVFGSHDASARLMLLGLGLTSMLTLLAARIRSNEASPSDGGSRLGRLQAYLLHYRFELTGLLFLIGFFAAPLAWNGATLLHSRLAGPAWGLLALTAGPRFDPPRIVTKLTAAVLPIGILLLSWPQFFDSDRTYRDLDSLIARIPKNSAVALASVDRPVYRTRVYSAATGPARCVADVGGRMSLSLVISPISPVMIRPEYRWDELDRRVLWSGSRTLKPAHDLRRFGWVIAQSRDPQTRAIIITAFKPDAEIVAAKGEWLLLRSTHPQVPMTVPDDPPPAGYETIMDRISYLIAKQNELHSASEAEPPGSSKTQPPIVPRAK